MDELTEALALATDQELHQVADILFRRKFNPLDYFAIPEVIEVTSWDRQAMIEAIAQRFRFLAADGLTVLKGQAKQVSYRQTLERVCQHLKVAYQQTQTVADIESELFLNMLRRSWQKLSPHEQQQLTQSIESALTASDLQKSLPPHAQSNPLSLVLKGGSAIAVSALVRPAVMNLLARQFAIHLAKYQVGREALAVGGNAIATRIQTYFSTYLAKRGMVMATGRLAAARTVFSFLTPALWGLFFADLGWRAIETNYSRIIPVIFTLAQIRLLRE